MKKRQICYKVWKGLGKIDK